MAIRRGVSFSEIIDPYRLFGLMQQAYCFLPYYFGGGKAFPPLRYQLHLTVKCNLDCSFCFQHNRGPADELSTDEWLNIIHQIPFFGIITISGGEVTLRPDFKILLNHCLNQTKVNLITNATLLDDEMIETFVEKKLFLMGISLDGLGATHDALRGRKGAFDKVMANLEKLRRARRGGYPMIDIKAVVLEKNMSELPELYKMAESMGCDFFTISFLKGCDLQYSPVIRAEFTEDFYRTSYPLKQYFDMGSFENTYQKLLELSETHKTRLRLNPEFLHVRSKKELGHIKAFYAGANSMKMQDVYRPCVSPWHAIALLPNGDVFPCLSYKTGNARNTPLKEIWNNDKYRMFRTRLRQHKIFTACQNCCYCRVQTDHLP